MANINTIELANWKAMFELEPFGDEWKQTATVAAATNRAMGGNAKPEDFMPPRIVRQQSSDEMEMHLRIALGGL